MAAAPVASGGCVCCNRAAVSSAVLRLGCGSSTNAALCSRQGFSSSPSPSKDVQQPVWLIRLTSSEPGKGEKILVDLEGEEWEGILTESNICFIKNKMKTNAYMYCGVKM